ncbi:MAG: hypothetical protein HY785_23765 [Oscillatoriophycideae cyanobacterium NC_groundwater_1537_Pr4_S-0.65um_50_18]|nr:hypothetical protein [Oscillatoriophycideae cyanobacterium NC_groundwater_1537_Pr4_S-0.65um_50_18]
MNKSVSPIRIALDPQRLQERMEAARSLEDKSRQSRLLPQVFNRRTGAFVGVAIAAVAGSRLVQVEPHATEYEGKLQLSLEPKAGNTGQSSLASATNGSVPTPSIDYETQARVFWSPKLLSPAIADLQQKYPDLTYERLTHDLKITHPEGTKNLEISYQDTDSQKAQAVLEKLSEVYLKYSQDAPTNSNTALQFIAERLPQLQQQVASAEEKMQEFPQQYGMENPDQLGQRLSEQSNALRQQQQDLLNQLIEAHTSYAVLQRQLDAHSEHLPEGQRLENRQAESQLLAQQSPRYQELLAQFQSIALQLTTARSEVGFEPSAERQLEQHYQQLSAELAEAAQQPLVDRLTQMTTAADSVDYQEINRLEALISLKAAENQVRMIEISYEAIAQTRVSLGDKIKQWAGLARQYDALELEVQLATDKMNVSLAKQAELQTFMQSAWQVVAPPQVKPVPESPFALSGTQRDFSLSLALCLIVAMWAMTLQESTTQSSQKQSGLPLPDLRTHLQRRLMPPPLALQMPVSHLLQPIDADYRGVPTFNH